MRNSVLRFSNTSFIYGSMDLGSGARQTQYSGISALENENLLEFYRKMLLVRVMEETHGMLLQEGKIQSMSTE